MTAHHHLKGKQLYVLGVSSTRTDVTTAKERKSTHGHTYLMRKWFELNYVHKIALKRKERNLRKVLASSTQDNFSWVIVCQMS